MPGAVKPLAEAIAVAGPQLVAFALGAVAGSLVPTYYAQERLRGFGRALFARLPYQPPPGMQREEAMQAATDDVDADDDGGGGGEAAGGDGGEGQPRDENGNFAGKNG